MSSGIGCKLSYLGVVLLVAGLAATVLAQEGEQAQPDAELGAVEPEGELGEEAAEGVAHLGNTGEHDIIEYDLADLLDYEIPKVVTSSRKEEYIDFTPNVMYVVSKDTIRMRGYRTLRDVFEVIPGFFTSYKPLEPILQVRGIAPNENNKVSYLINGHRINNVNESTDLIWPLSLDRVERIEIIVGPGSVLYGSETLVAVVNLIMEDVDGFDVSLSYGQNGLASGDLENGHNYSVTLAGGTKLDERRKVSASVTLAQDLGWESEGFMRHSGEKIGPEGRDMLHRRLDVVRPSVWVQTEGQWDAVSIQASSINQAIPEYSQNREANELSESEKVHATRYNYVDSVVALFEPELGANFTGRASLAYDSKRMIRGIDSGCPDCGGTLDTHQKLYSTELGVQYRSKQHFLQFGVQGWMANNRHNYSISGWDPSENPNENPDSSGTVDAIVDEETHFVQGVYVSEEYRPWERLSLVAAARLDHSTQTRDDTVFLSPRLAVVGHPFDFWIVKALFNTATKYPSPWESQDNKVWNYERGASWATTLGPAKEPERLTAYELQSVFYYDKLRVALNGYYQQLQNFIAWGNGFTNIGDFDGYGVEIDAEYTLRERYHFWLNAAWKDTFFDSRRDDDTTDWDHGQVEDPDGDMNSVPAFTANVGVDLELLEDLFVSSTVRYFTGQVARIYDVPSGLVDDWPSYLEGEGNYRWTTIDHIAYWDLSIFWRNVGMEGLDLRLSGKNLTDNRSRVSVQYANGDFEARGLTAEMAVFFSY
ncbi:MAG: TonB-dependent receptor [Myxococcota bacterium]|nr:TonB-dependent receptor [Myxococcota bacterium]